MASGYPQPEAMNLCFGSLVTRYRVRCDPKHKFMASGWGQPEEVKFVLRVTTDPISGTERKKVMEHTSKDLLHLEHKNSSTSSIESALLVCNKKDLPSQSKKPNPDKKPICNPVARSQVLDKVKSFLGVISEANKKLQFDAKGNAQDYDIEVLNGDESEVIEMDIMLGVADLHTPEAVIAAESAIAGNQPVIPLAASSSETESDNSSDDDTDGDEDSDNEDNKTDFPMNVKRSETSKDDSGSKAAEKKQSKKRPKIVELS
ncbi:hypothetical protein EZV62_011020 [Acer yangbiense]|uniref:Uncharacterized protein n=1 Tax=Acer yangbiense TaxID=1000413 RepID=A0A5C7I6A2_9ROSI|nr:hypothetical protein EZV62_011020 [Acer yangbiense]